MRKDDMIWSYDRQYYHRDGFLIVIHDDAPDYVKESYNHYVQQCIEQGEKYKDEFDDV